MTGAEAILDVLRGLDRLNHGDPTVDREEVLARKRQLVESLEAAFYDLA